MGAARLTRCLLGLLVAGLLACVPPAASAAGAGSEPFFPHEGNAGYEVDHYDVDLAYQPSKERLVATTRIEATATAQRLRGFSLDLDGLRVTAVSVDGAPAKFSRGKDKLRVTAKAPILAGEEFTVLVSYRGHPRTVIDTDGSAEGWYPTPDGAVAVGEPLGTAAWLPSNNVPADKASFEITITVPTGLKAMSNGRLLGITRKGAHKTYAWRESKPMSTYLAVVDIGRGVLTRGRIGNLPSWTLVDPALAKHSRRSLARLPEIVNFEVGVFGPYPFEAIGSIVDAANLEYALETQTRPVYAFAPDLTTVVHETAHQWFGDSVGLARWPDIWLNEGFATWTEWYYAERHGRRGALQTFRRLYKTPASATGFWDPPSGHPGKPENLFATSTYVRGGMALEALRVKIGTPKFLRLLRRWVSEHRYGSATIKEFEALATQVAARPLGNFFDQWLFQRGKPRGYGSL
jgi:aminopeptidase N